MATQHFILVAGFNYENDKNPTFLQSCNNRMTRTLEKASAPESMIFTLFDVAGGTVTQSKVDPKTKRRGWTKLQTFTAVTRANYSSFKVGVENHFDTKPAGIMSITDVYKFVEDIGASSDKGTVEELNFFSHGWMGGPILVNSFDPTSDDPSQPRNPNDKDARIFKDFVPPTMDATALVNFNTAFAGDGFVWTWGCSFARAAHVVLSQLFKTSKYRTTPPAKIKDTDKFTLDFSEDAKTPSPTDDFNTIVNTLLPGGKKSGRSYTITVTFKQIKDLFHLELDSAYAAVLASSTNITGIGAMPGTYADTEKNVRLPQMLVPQRMPPYDDDLSATVKFYTTFMGMSLDPENRGYGQFP